MKFGLKKIIGFSMKQDKTVFWIFWILFIFGSAFRFAEPYEGDPADPKFPFAWWGIIIGSMLIGILVWKLLQWEKISSIKDFVIGLQGLILYAFAGFAIWLVLVGIIFVGFNVRTHVIFQILVIAAAILSLVPGLILGGCWLGFKIHNRVALTTLWCIIIAGLLFRYGYGGLFVTVVLVPSLIGTYIGKTRLAHTEKKA